MSPSLFVFIALPCEAKPLIQNWGLKKLQGTHPFAIFADRERVVVVTGIGKVLMAGAVGYTLSLFPDRRHPLLLNLGIAGHRENSLGSLYLAEKILNKDTGKNFYPQLPFHSPVKTAMVATLATPQSSYDEDCLYDMEAAAFYEMACKFSSNELIHCLKIVSDNTQSPLENINENVVETWISEQMNPIADLIALLSSMRGRLPQIDYTLYQEMITKFHFTASNSDKLKNLLQRQQLLSPDLEPKWRDAECRSGKELLVWLEKQLEETCFYL